jgi:hypothetical protein
LSEASIGQLSAISSQQSVWASKGEICNSPMLRL